MFDCGKGPHTSSKRVQMLIALASMLFSTFPHVSLSAMEISYVQDLKISDITMTLKVKRYILTMNRHMTYDCSTYLFHQGHK